MPASFIQSLGSAASQVQQQTVTLTLTVAVTAGSTIMCSAIQAGTSGFNTVTDSKGNVYTKLRQHTTATSHTTATFMARNVAALAAGDNITLTSAATDQYPVITASEYAGVTGDPVATVFGTGTASNTYTTNSAAVPVGDHLLYATLGLTGAGRSQTPNGTWTKIGASGDAAPQFSRTVMSMYDIVPGGGTLQASGTFSATGDWAVQAFALPASSGGGVTPDTTAPTVPTGLTATPASSSQINLAWTASTDAVGVTGYVVRRGGTSIATVTGTTYSDTSLTAATTYSYTVAARDAAGNESAQTAAVSTAPQASGATPAPTSSAFTIASDSQIASLSITSAAALRAKAIADGVKAGTYVAASGAVNNWHDTDSKTGAIALTTALWWARTGDNSYLAPLITYMRNTPLTPPDNVGTSQALDPMRQIGPFLAAVEILRRKGQWSASTTLPNHGNDTYAQFINGGGSQAEPLETRLLIASEARWSRIRKIPASNASTIDDSASNWGAVARFAHLMVGVEMAALAGTDPATTEPVQHAVKLMKKWLGDQTTGIPDFKSSGAYINSWDNWTVQASGSNQALKAGIGKTDATNLGLDGVVLNDIDRGNTGYNAANAYYGATAAGLTYPLEAADYVWAEVAVLINAGFPVRTWGEGGNAFDRMNARFARVRSGDTHSLFSYSEGASSVYGGGRFIAAQLSRTSYGTAAATAAGTGGLSRAMPYGDWLAPADGSSTWGTLATAAPAAPSSGTASGSWDFTSTSVGKAPVASSLTRFTVGRDAVLAGTGALDFVVIGDSLVEGLGVDVTGRWATKLMQRFRSRWQPAGVPGGEGYVPSNYFATGVSARWVYSGGTPNLSSQYGLGHRHHHWASGPIVQELTWTGTSIQVMWAGSTNTGIIDISIDGGPVTSVNTATGFTSTTPTGGGSWFSGVLTRGSHTIRMTNTSGKTVLLSGAHLYDGDENTGVRLWEAGHSGWEAEDYANRSPNNSSHAASIAKINPHLVVLALGYNDARNGRTAAQFETDLTKIITDIKAAFTGTVPDFLIVGYEQRDDITAALWNDYLAAMQRVAAAQGASYVATSAVPTSDGVHPTTDGHTTLAQEVEAHLAPQSTTKAGSATGAFAFTGSSVGRAVRRATATPGAFTFTGSAVGRAVRRATAAPGAFAFAGAASGKAVRKGTVTAAWNFTAAAVGRVTRRGSASGTATFTGVAGGGVPRLGTSAPGTFRFTGSAVGKESPKGSASGTVGFVSTAGGKSRTGGTAFGLTRFAATTSARTARRGSASGMTNVVSSAVGFTPANGIGAATLGTFRFVGGANGDRGRSGAASGLLAFSGSARGSRTRNGRAVGSWRFSGGAYTAPPRWVATETIFFGEGAAFVRAFNDDDPVPRSVILHRSIIPVVPTPGSTA